MIVCIRNVQLYCNFSRYLWSSVCASSIGDCRLCRPAVSAELRLLRRDGWIDRQTRAVIIEWTMFHTQSTLFSSVKLMLEISPIGRAVTSLHVASVFLYKYTSNMDYVVLVSEACSSRLVSQSVNQSVSWSQAARPTYSHSTRELSRHVTGNVIYTHLQHRHTHTHTHTHVLAE